MSLEVFLSVASQRIQYSSLKFEMQTMIDVITSKVKDSRGVLDLQIRSNYFTIYYKGGSIWRVLNISRRVIELRPAFILKGINNLGGEKEKAEEILSECSDEIPWLDYDELITNDSTIKSYSSL